MILLRLWPLGLVLVGLGLSYALGFQRYLSFQALREHQFALQEWVAVHPVGAPVVFVAVYAAVVAVSLPVSVVLTMSGGLLFGTGVGAALSVAGATTGAVLLFLAARHAVGDWRAGPLMARLRQDGFSYLLAIRLMPVFPFWLVNLAPAVAGMRLLPFAAATGLGIVPATIVFASVGAGVGSVLQQGGTPDLSVALWPLAGLAALSLLPVAYRRWKRA